MKRLVHPSPRSCAGRTLQLSTLPLPTTSKITEKAPHTQGDHPLGALAFARKVVPYAAMQRTRICCKGFYNGRSIGEAFALVVVVVKNMRGLDI